MDAGGEVEQLPRDVVSGEGSALPHILNAGVNDAS